MADCVGCDRADRVGDVSVQSRLFQDDGVELSRVNLVALQDRSRALEGELMASSRYNGSGSEQALLFRLADVDTQLTAVNQSDSLSSMRQRQLFWQ